MSIALITGPANAGKAQVVMDGVRRHLAHGEEPLLIVPTRADADYYRRELAGEGTALGVRVERFEGLIGEAVGRAGGRSPVLGGLARERVLAAISPPGATPGLVRAVGAFFAELQVRRVTPASLRHALGASTRMAASGDGEGAPSPLRAGPEVQELGPEIGGLFEEYHRVLRAIGRVDAEQRAVQALDALRRRPALWGQTPVLFYGFDDLTRLQLDAIETLGAVVGASVTVSLTYEPGRTAFAGRASTFHALEPLAAEHRALAARAEHYAPHARVALSHLERSLFEPDVARVDPAGAVRLLEGGGQRAELELVAREVAGLLERGIAPEEIAVVLRAPVAVAEEIEEVFAAARVPYVLQRRKPFADTAIGRALIGWLRCATSQGQAGDLLAWLRAPGLLEQPELADQLEAAARGAGAGSAAQARALWEQSHWPLQALDQLGAAQERGAWALIERATRELEWLFCAPRRGRAEVLADEAELEEARALVAGRRALGELGELTRLAVETAPGDAGALARALEGLELLGGERPALGAVAVLDPLALRARRVRALFVCGLQEGVFPAPARSQPLLSAEERRGLAEVSGLRLAEHEDALAAERYLLYAAVSRPQELLVLSWHTADDDGAPTARSLFVDDVCDLFAESLGEQVRRRSLGAVGWPRVGAQLELEGVGGEFGFARSRPEGLAPLRDAELLTELREHVWSASSLEVWMSCPVRWLVDRLLRAGDLDPDPEPIARGALAHAVLRDTLEGLKRERGSARLTPGCLRRARELLRLALDAREEEFPLSTAPERRPGMRRRLEVDLERYLEHAAACESPLEPTYLELGFGFGPGDARGEGDVAGAGLPAFDLGAGTLLRGRIDRVDIGGGSEAVVYDYKGRDAPPPARWGASGGHVQVALYMRAIEGLLGLRAVGGLYQPLTGPDLRARGLLDSEAEAELQCVKGDARERSEVRELLDETVAAARQAAAEAGRGELRRRPQTCAFRGGCRYPTICRCEG
jgi:PD-(D/E)XK nuclease superfamily